MTTLGTPVDHDPTARTTRGTLRRVRAVLAPLQPLWDRAGRSVHGIAVANVVVQVGIVVTGGVVRLTGSGLGCPTWPECRKGSITPVVQQAQGYHKYIEFGNRLLTFVLVAVAVAVIVAVRNATRDRTLRRLGAVPLLGVVAQIVLGGITVLTKLSPWSVASHFLLSMVLVAAATVLWLRTAAVVEAGSDRSELRLLAGALAVTAAAVLGLGTIVTGSGPHSGDAQHPSRFGFDVRAVSWLHADVVLLFTGLVIALLLGLRLIDATARMQRTALVLLGVTLSQAVIGYTQYFLAVPALLVGLHMLGAGLLTVAVTAAVDEVRRGPDPVRLRA